MRRRSGEGKANPEYAGRGPCLSLRSLSIKRIRNRTHVSFLERLSTITMSVALDYPHVKKSADGPAHLIRIPRVRVAQIVMDYLGHGWSPDEMCRQHPYLTPAEAHAAMGYYFDHQAEIDQEIRAEIELAERESALESPLPVILQLRAQRARQMPVALYMDVHVPLAIVEQLRRRGVDVLTAIEGGFDRNCHPRSPMTPRIGGWFVLPAACSSCRPFVLSIQRRRGSGLSPGSDRVLGTSCLNLRRS